MMVLSENEQPSLPMSFSQFILDYGLKIREASNKEMQQKLGKLGLNSRVRVLLRDGIFSSNSGILNLQPSKGTHWVCCEKDSHLASYGCPTPDKFLIA